jgi:hypothetical protein
MSIYSDGLSDSGTEYPSEGQADHRVELIDFPNSNPYPPIKAALPDRARHTSNIRRSYAHRENKKLTLCEPLPDNPRADPVYP